jgi:hypothetical protein
VPEILSRSENALSLRGRRGHFRRRGRRRYDVIMLYVVKGNFFITIGIGGMAGEVAALEKAKQVAQKILAQL